MTWHQHKIGLATVFIANVVISLALIVVAMSHEDRPVSNESTHTTPETTKELTHDR